MLSIEEEDSYKTLDYYNQSESNSYLRQILCYDRHLKKDRTWVLHPRKKDKNYVRPYTSLSRLSTKENPQGYLTIINLQILAYVSHLHLFAPRMDPLEHISTRFENTKVEIWFKRGSIRFSIDIGPPMIEAACITRQACINASIYRITGIQNLEANTTPRLTHLLVSDFLLNFFINLSHPTYCRISLLKSTARHPLHTMLLVKHPPNSCPLQDSAKITPHENSGKPYTGGSTFLITPKGSNIQSHSQKSFLTRFVQESWPPRERKFSSKA